MKTTDFKRLGERKLYSGVFALVRTDNIFKYAPYGKFTNIDFLKTFKPKVKLENEPGIYISKECFTVNGGDLFSEEQLPETDDVIPFSFMPTTV